MTCHIRVRRLAAVLHNLQGTQSQAICPAGWTLTVLMVLFHTYLLVWKIVTVSHSLNRIVHACRISLSQPTLTIQWGWQRTRVSDSLSESLFHWSNFNQAVVYVKRFRFFFNVQKHLQTLTVFDAEPWTRVWRHCSCLSGSEGHDQEAVPEKDARLMEMSPVADDCPGIISDQGWVTERGASLAHIHFL